MIEGVCTKAQFDYVASLAKLLLDRNKLNWRLGLLVARLSC